MAVQTNISFEVSSKQVFDLVKKLPSKDKKKLIVLLEEEQYINNIPEEDKETVRKRIKKYSKSPGLLINEKQALKIINAV